MTKFQGGIISSTQNVAIGNQYTGRANGVWALPHQMQSKQAALWAQNKSAPSAPTITSATAGNTIATVEFSPPASLNGETVTGYTVTSSGGQTATGASSPIIVTGLTNGTNYTFTVVANSTSGPSVASNTSSSVIPAEFFVPGAPTIGTAAVQYNVANVPFTAPASDGGKPITSYTATSSPGGITGTLNQSGSGTIVVTGLTAGVSYTFTVTATNMIGNSSPSVASNSVSASATPNSLWSWGRNDFGQLGLGNTTYYSSPKQVGTLGNWSNVGNGYLFSVATKTDGTLWTWGKNDYRQLGLVDNVNRSSPTQVGALTNWSSVTVGTYSVLAIKTDGTLWGWGDNAYGVLGTSSANSLFGSPVQIGSLNNWAQVSMQSHTLAVKTNGTLWAWGYNGSNQLGLGNATIYESPVQVGSLTNWRSVFAGEAHSLAIKTDGTIWSWGYNINGQLGLGDSGGATRRSSPTQVGALTNWLTATGLYGYTVASKSDGTLWGWGSNNYGQLGLGNTTNYSSPKQIGASTNWNRVSSNRYTTMAIKTDGTLWSWGYNGNGQLGLGNTTNYSSPKQVGSLTNWIRVAAGYQTLASQSAISLPGAPTGVTATRIPNATSATVSFTAPANNGGLTISKYTATSSPGGITGVLNQAGSGSITVTGLDANTAYTFTVTATNFMGTGPASSSVATVAPATLWSWGNNESGQLGLGNTTNYSSPKQVGTLTDWLSVSGGMYFAMALKTNSTLWAVGGSNSSYQLGLIDYLNRSSPVQVGALSEWSKITNGNKWTIALRNNGTLWSWGRNNAGQLGLGDTTNRSSPVQVGTLTDWLNIGGGGYHMLATKTNGTLWSWGKNTYGELGLGDTTNRSSPVQVGTLTDWLNVTCGYYHALAIKTDGTLWSWGTNNAGQLGIGTLGTNYSSPKQVGSSNTWASVSAGNSYTLAIKTDGTLWSWGNAVYGKLGLGSSSNYIPSPIQVGALTNWSKITCAYHHAASIKTDGTLWTWGRNNLGQLGLGDSGTNRSSPVQVGTLTSWLNVAASGYFFTHATRVVSAPDAPTITSATRSTGSTTATINFTAPYNGGYPITSYTATSSPGGITGSVSQAGSGSITVTGLDTNTTYTFTVTATNFMGAGPASSSVATVAPATLWSWGHGGSGRLGLGNTTNYSSPKQVGTLTNWLNVSGGLYHSHGIKIDGTLWAWGINTNGVGQLGLGNSTYYSSPVQVGALTNWVIADSGYKHTAAIKNDGSLWTWGYNYWGMLGLGDIDPRSSPVQVGSDTNWSSVSCGAYQTFGIKSDGTLWAWGDNAYYGQLGLGDTVGRSSPVQVGTLNDWAKAGGTSLSSFAIKTDGTLWTWGHGGYGELGLGNSTDYSSPKQVGALTNWSTITGGYSHIFSIKTDGTLWAFGSGAGVSSNSPIQVGALTTWSTVNAGYGYVAGIRTDRTLWTWGANQYGQLGLGDTVTRTSPTQVGSLTNWLKVAACGYHTLATRT